MIENDGKNDSIISISAIWKLCNWTFFKWEKNMKYSTIVYSTFKNGNNCDIGLVFVFYRLKMFNFQTSKWKSPVAEYAIAVGNMMSLTKEKADLFNKTRLESNHT